MAATRKKKYTEGIFCVTCNILAAAKSFKGICNYSKLGSAVGLIGLHKTYENILFFFLVGVILLRSIRYDFRPGLAFSFIQTYIIPTKCSDSV